MECTCFSCSGGTASGLVFVLFFFFKLWLLVFNGMLIRCLHYFLMRCFLILVVWMSDVLSIQRVLLPCSMVLLCFFSVFVFGWVPFGCGWVSASRIMRGLDISSSTFEWELISYLRRLKSAEMGVVIVAGHRGSLPWRRVFALGWFKGQ